MIEINKNTFIKNVFASDRLQGQQKTRTRNFEKNIRNGTTDSSVLLGGRQIKQAGFLFAFSGHHLCFIVISALGRTFSSRFISVCSKLSVLNPFQFRTRRKNQVNIL